MKKNRVSLIVGLLPFIFAAACHSLDEAAVQTSSEVYLYLPAAPYSYSKQLLGRTVDSFDQQATLGRVLFYDRHLSVNNSVSCGSCHRQATAFADNLAQSRGFENRLTGRNTPALQNLFSSGIVFGGGFVSGPFGGSGGGRLFWDGRETDLAGLIARPVSNHIEMGIGNFDELVAKLAALPYYTELFREAFGSTDINMDKVSRAVAGFVGSINSVDTRFDQHQKGIAKFSALEQEGEMLFNRKYDCAQCHNEQIGGYFSGDFANIGLDENPSDKGLGNVSGQSIDNGRFKIPNLRNVALTAPYMHDGRFKSLDAVIEHYNKDIRPATNLDTRLRTDRGVPKRMNISTQEKTALIAFLNTLTDVDMITNPAYADPFKMR